MMIMMVLVIQRKIDQGGGVGIVGTMVGSFSLHTPLDTKNHHNTTLNSQEWK